MCACKSCNVVLSFYLKMCQWVIFVCLQCTCTPIRYTIMTTCLILCFPLFLSKWVLIQWGGTPLEIWSVSLVPGIKMISIDTLSPVICEVDSAYIAVVYLGQPRDSPLDWVVSNSEAKSATCCATLCVEPFLDPSCFAAGFIILLEEASRTGNRMSMKECTACRNAKIVGMCQIRHPSPKYHSSSFLPTAHSSVMCSPSKQCTWVYFHCSVALSSSSVPSLLPSPVDKGHHEHIDVLRQFIIVLSLDLQSVLGISPSQFHICQTCFHYFICQLSVWLKANKFAWLQYWSHILYGGKVGSGIFFCRIHCCFMGFYNLFISITDQCRWKICLKKTY